MHKLIRCMPLPPLNHDHAQTYPRDGLAADLGNIEGIAAHKEGDFDAKDEEEEDDE